MEKYLHEHMGKKCKHKHKIGKVGETQFMDVNKEYDFDVYKMDPSVNVMTKTKTNF